MYAMRYPTEGMKGKIVSVKTQFPSDDTDYAPTETTERIYMHISLMR